MAFLVAASVLKVEKMSNFLLACVGLAGKTKNANRLIVVNAFLKNVDFRCRSFVSIRQRIQPDMVYEASGFIVLRIVSYLFEVMLLL